MSREKPVVTATYGMIEGIIENDVYAFKGVPYAASIAGENRWLSPKKPACWEGIKDTKKFGQIPPQISPNYKGKYANIFGPFIIPKGTQGDDCLNLNVWTDSISPEKKKPIMVWIYGGSLMVGAAEDIYSGHKLAQKGAVVMSMNYRVGVHGFLALDELFEGEYGNGNRGHLDQIAAIKWIKENAEAFGGDPENITIFGESAGAVSVMALLASPLTNGLFQRAICQSGFIQDVPLCDHTVLAMKALKKLKVKPGDKEALNGVSNERLVKLAMPLMIQVMLPWIKNKYGLFATRGTAFTQATGTEFLPMSVLDCIKAGNAKGINLLIGTNLNECRMTALMNGGMKKGIRNYWMMAGGNIGNRKQKKEAIKLYSKASPEKDIWHVKEEILSDAVFRRSTLQFADAQSTVNPDGTFMYRFDKQAPVHNGDLGASHMMEIPFVFDLLKEWELLAGPHKLSQPLATKVSDACVHFARTGTPFADGLPEWKPYDTGAGYTMLLDNECLLVENPIRELIEKALIHN